MLSPAYSVILYERVALKKKIAPLRKNGSGKSTISKAMRKAKGDIVDDIVQAILLG